MDFNPFERFKRYEQDKQFRQQFQATFEIRKAKMRVQKELDMTNRGLRSISLQAAKEAEKGAKADKALLMRLLEQKRQLDKTAEAIAHAQTLVVRIEGKVNRARVMGAISQVTAAVVPALQGLISMKAISDISSAARQLEEADARTDLLMEGVDEALETTAVDAPSGETGFSRADQSELETIIAAGKEEQAQQQQPAASSSGDEVTEAELNAFLDQFKKT